MVNGEETVDGIMRSFWEEVYATIERVAGPCKPDDKVEMVPMKASLAQNSCPLAPGPSALLIRINGEVIAYAVKPVCTLSGKNHNRVMISWAVRAVPHDLVPA